MAFLWLTTCILLFGSVFSQDPFLGGLPPLDGDGEVLPPLGSGEDNDLGGGVLPPIIVGGGDGDVGGGELDQSVKLCTFDDNTWCNMERDGSEHRWSLDASGSSTSPSGDHTSGSGVYARFYVDASEIADFDRYSLLTVYKTEEKGEYCLSFWYQMDGEGQGRITVTGGPKREQIANGYQGENWMEGQFTMNAIAPGQP